MAKQKKKPAPKDPAQFQKQLKMKLSNECRKYEIYLNRQDMDDLKKIADKLDEGYFCSEADKTVELEFYSQVEQDIRKTMRKVYARSSNWSKTEKLVKELDATLKILTGDEQKSLYVADTKKQQQFVLARSWLESMQQKQSSCKRCEDPEPECDEETQYWINTLNTGIILDKTLVELEVERSTLDLFKDTDIEQVFFNPRTASLANLINYMRDRLCENSQHQIFASGEDSCHLLPFKTAPHQPPKWMLVELRDQSAKCGVYMRGDNLYITAFRNQKNMIYELVESDNLRIIEGSFVFGCNADYPALVKYDREVEDLPKEEADRRLLEIIFNLEENAADVHLLANYDHTQKMDDAERRQAIENVQKALIRKMVVLSEVSRFVNLFIAVNADWNNSIASLTKLLLTFMRRWGPMSKKVRNSNSSDVLPKSLQDNLGLKFVSDLIKVMHLVLNTKHPELNKIGRSTPAEPSGGIPEASGSSYGDCKEAKSKARPSNGNPDPSGSSDSSLGQSCGSHAPSRPSDCGLGQSWLSDSSPGPSDGSPGQPRVSDGSHADGSPEQTGASGICPVQSGLYVFADPSGLYVFPDPSGSSDSSLGQFGGSHASSRPSGCSLRQSWLSDVSPGPSDGSPGQPRPSDGSHADGSPEQTGASGICPVQSGLYVFPEQSGLSAVSYISSVISSAIESLRMAILFARSGSIHPLSHHPLGPVRIHAPLVPLLRPSDGSPEQTGKSGICPVQSGHPLSHHLLGPVRVHSPFGSST
ncbi:uncharacterized protein LOC119323491 isoform X1 [Triticum dicoccoides]|uniref:uncharacterized protein LOC119323491 isoform X1 n=1 Tax=Triticum dicoccoides TaxID=85692 RepID=UPI000E7884AE|nr:uncharacterized protein LOC119323491 isoform X1 [Triticum dicoccoides]XP_037453059.1 uncharacterized protein LOC119323491 isoform X1 [Triticum dicoccoides]XP_037453060.1 uncharacterized protein LOC119323491 isoform X1 [Triticum dicoccoides]XP_037453061.1 uncharacterized protein LOC119323491 isoform X1 [Triticum dicoccoides]XP_037453062.1 uncharacterized protein LOC119323491 isoform X1 [Triticum dicoccoides]XP_037453063.1 uncharacterized protein LOC119323491 isoform X1 [Triticum dicoccoides]